MNKINGQFRQGDVLIQKVASLPAGTKPQKTTMDVILAEGEMTGHAHRITRPNKKVRQHLHGAQLYLEVLKPVKVQHEEHGEIPLEPGIYLVLRQMETWMDEVRQVAD